MSITGFSIDIKNQYLPSNIVCLSTVDYVETKKSCYKVESEWIKIVNMVGVQSKIPLFTDIDFRLH